MRIYLFRHGQAVPNDEERVPWDDAPLTERGIQEATEVWRYAQDGGIARIYTSPLERALATARIISENLHTKYVIRPNLQDRKYGSVSREKWEDVGGIRKNLDKDPHYSPPDGESYIQVEARVVPELRHILQLHDDAIGIVGHGEISRIIIASHFGIPFEKSSGIGHPTSCMYILDTKEQTLVHWWDGTKYYGEFAEQLFDREGRLRPESRERSQRN